MREWDALLQRVISKVEIPNQFWRRAQLVAVKNHRKPRKRRESFAAHTRSKVNIPEIHRHRADGTNTIETKLCTGVGTKAFELFKIVENSSGGLAVRRPHPIGS